MPSLNSHYQICFAFLLFTSNISNHTSILLNNIFHLDIPFLLVKSLMKFDTLDSGFSPTVYLAMAQMFQKWITANNSCHYHCDIYISIFSFLSVQSLFLMTPSFLFLFIYSLLCWTLEKLIILMKSFWNKDEISFFNLLSVFLFILFSTNFFYTSYLFITKLFDHKTKYSRFWLSVRDWFLDI